MLGFARPKLDTPTGAPHLRPTVPRPTPTFQPDDPEAESEDLRSRSDARRENKRLEERLARLAAALIALSTKQLARLALPDELRDRVLEARRIESPAARDRALRSVRVELRGLDVTPIERDLAAIPGALAVPRAPRSSGRQRPGRP